MNPTTQTDVKQIDRESCYFCGAEPPLERHHILPIRIGGTDTDRNLVDLCPNCHTKIERLYDDRILSNIADRINSEPASTYEWVDHYDESVLRRLSEGAKVSKKALYNLYKSNTSIRNNDTAKARVETLLNSDLFDENDGVEYVYVGVGSNG